MRGEGFVGGLHATDRMVDSNQPALQVAGAGLQEQPHQRAPHHTDRLAPRLGLGIRRVHRQDRLLLAQLDDRVADLQHHEHPAQQIALHLRLADRKPVGLVQQVAGAAFKARRQALELAADGIHHLLTQVLLHTAPQPAAVGRQNDRPRRRAHQHADDHGDVVVDKGVRVVDREVIRHRTGAEEDQQAHAHAGVSGA